MFGEKVPGLKQSHNNKLTQVDLPGLRLWFSYETLVAFAVDYDTPTVLDYPSVTTQRQLASIDGKAKERTKARLDSREFEAAFAQAWAPFAGALAARGVRR